MQQDAQAKAQLAQYEDELARKRNDAEHHKNRERNQELVALQEQSNRNQQNEKRRIQEQIEGERRATEKYKAGANNSSDSIHVARELTVTCTMQIDNGSLHQSVTCVLLHNNSSSVHTGNVQYCKTVILNGRNMIHLLVYTRIAAA